MPKNDSHMTKSELLRAQHTLGLTGEAMAELLGIGQRSYYYRLSGERAITKGETELVRQALEEARQKAQEEKRDD